MKRIVLPLLTLTVLAASCGDAATDATSSGSATAQVTPLDGQPVLSADTTIANGPIELKYEGGTPRIKGNVRDHKRHGMWSSYFPDGRPQSFSSYVDGVLNGTTVVYHPNGAIYYTGDY